MDSARDAHGTLRETLFDALRSRAEPLLVGEGFGIPAASLWTGARTWVNRFRAAGLRPGERVVLALPRSPAFIMAMVAAWWEGLTVCPVPEAQADRAEDLLGAFDASALIALREGRHVLGPTAAGGASESRFCVRASGAPTEGVALIMTTSGTSGNPTRVALSFSNLLHQLESHTRALGLTRSDRVLSVLPWHHAFGLLVELWPALLSGASVFTEGSEGRAPESVVRAAEAHEVTWISLVPLQAQSLAETPGGRALLDRVGGVVGGAPISASLASILRGTRLRVGYGQTEASPGITLGAPGVFVAGSLGKPLGCETRVEAGELLVRGKNVCAGVWRDGALRRLDPNRWLETGDLVEETAGGLVFVGRVDQRFKLSNGKMIDAPSLERAIERVVPGCEAVVSPAADTGFRVALVGGGGPLDEGVERAVRSALGPVCRYLVGIDRLMDGSPLRTRKGEIDRGVLIKAGACGDPISTIAD